MDKKRIIAVIFIIISIIIISLAVIGLYQTFAISSTADSTTDDTYFINLGDTNTVTVPANSSKTVYYKLTNTNNGTVKYGIAYSGTDVVVYEWDDSNDPAGGTIDYQENKFIKLYIKNNGTKSNEVTINTVLGYNNAENLIAPSGSQLVKTKVSNLAKYLLSLYSPNATELNNEITYELDTINYFIEDIDGNIRYFGASPSNYINFNCDTYPSVECETWRIIGVFDGKVKLIKNNLLGNFSWDYDDGANYNDWTTATLQVFLNGAYLNNQNTIYNNYSSNGVIAVNANFNTEGYGIKANTKGFISNFNYPLGRWNTNYDGYVDDYYESERGSIVPGDVKINWLGKIALPYVSDYGYASDIRNCKQMLLHYNTEGCISTNWMYSMFGTATAFLNTASDLSTNELIISNGVRGSRNTNEIINVFPVLYLNSNVVIELSGTGSNNYPYKIV